MPGQLILASPRTTSLKCHAWANISWPAQGPLLSNVMHGQLYLGQPKDHFFQMSYMGNYILASPRTTSLKCHAWATISRPAQGPLFSNVMHGQLYLGQPKDHFSQMSCMGNFILASPRTTSLKCHAWATISWPAQG